MATKEEIKIKESISFLKKKEYQILKPNELRCMCCGKSRSVWESKNWFMSWSPVHRGNTASYKYSKKEDFKDVVAYRQQAFAPICRHCIEEVYLKDADIKDVVECLRLLDKPFIQDVWTAVYEKESHRMRPGSMLGTYISNMSLNYKKLTFKDSEEYVENKGTENEKRESKKAYNKKWMGTYTKSDIAHLDGYLEGLREDFNIVTKNHTDYAKKIAKASLVMDKEYEKIIDGSGSVTDYDKYKKIFDDLSKSAQFAESGRGKGAIGNGLSEIVETVESKQWIISEEEYDADELDILLNQFSNINKSL